MKAISVDERLDIKMNIIEVISLLFILNSLLYFCYLSAYDYSSLTMEAGQCILRCDVVCG